jgi:hypothetical protein
VRLVILESPFAGDIPRNKAYARVCLRDSLLRSESPIASHLLYTQPGILDDTIPDEREWGINAGLEWYTVASACIVCVDLGISRGMLLGMERAKSLDIPVIHRSIGWTPRRASLAALSMEPF